jgi:putative transposase
LGLSLKTCTIVRKADGWYCCISMQDESVPYPLPLSEVKTCTGVDVGLKEFLTTAEGEIVSIPQFYRQSQYHLARQQRKLSRKNSGSLRQLKQQNRVARIHQKIQRQRTDFHYRVAYNLLTLLALEVRGFLVQRASLL